MTATRRTVLGAAAMMAAFGLATVPASAQDDYPSKAITMIVPFGAGGGFDQMARTIAPILEEELGVPVAVKNSPGAGGRRGTIELFRSEPDGYTMGLSYFVPFLTDRHILKKDVPIDLEEFEVLYRTTHDAHFLYVRKDGPYQSFEDLGKAEGKIKVSSTGIGSSAWIAASMMGQLVGFEPTFIAGYDTLGEAALAVARGDADASVGGVPHIGGVVEDVQPLVYFGGERDPQFPDVPTATELGYPDTTLLGGIHVFSAPPGTPEDRQEALREAFRTAVKDERFKAWAEGNSTQIVPGEPDEVRAQNKRIGEVFEKLPVAESQ